MIVTNGTNCNMEAGCSRDQAQEECEKEGGYLARITTREENEQIKILIRDAENQGLDIGNRAFLWIGLRDTQEEGKWVWDEDVGETSFTDWIDGQPGESGDDMDCVAMRPNIDCKWIDARCSRSSNRTLPFCELRSSAETTSRQSVVPWDLSLIHI